MRPASTRSKWLRIARTLVLGIVLGLLQLLLLLLSVQMVFSFWGPYFALGALFNVLIPAIAGFLAARKEEATLAGIGAGCLVTGISFCILVIVIAVGSVMLLAAPQSPSGCTLPCVDRYPVLSPWGILEGIIIIEALGAVPGGMLGGLIGGWLGRATLSSKSGQPEARP